MLNIKIKMALLIAFAISLGCSADSKNSQVLDWVMKQNIKDRKVYQLQLPANLASEAVDKQVAVGRVNNQYFILLKRILAGKIILKRLLFRTRNSLNPKFQ